MSNPLFNALANAYGGNDPGQENVEKFPGLLAYSKRWLTNDEDVKENVLKAALQKMQFRVEEAAKATQVDIDKADPNSVMLDPMERSKEAYLAIAEGIGQMLEAVDANDSASYEEGHSLFQEAVDEMREATEAMDNFLASNKPHCPRCGGAGPEPVCPTCSLERLVPDAESLNEPALETAELGPEYVIIFKTYSDVVAGKTTLSNLWPSFSALERQLENIEQLTQGLLAEEETAEIGETMKNIVEHSYNGIDKMRSVHENRQLRELVGGWNMIFEAACAMQNATVVLNNAFDFDEDEEAGTE